MPVALDSSETRRLDQLFDYVEIAPDVFRAPPTHSPMVRLYGGQVFAQALAAAQRTVTDGRLANSCHAYFIRPGDPAHTIDFAVIRDSDGRSFSARRVTATQGDKLILSLAVSMHVDEPGAQHQFAMPEVAAPEGLASQATIMSAIGARLPTRHRAFWLLDMGVDYRPVEPFVTFDPAPRPARRHFWFRLTGAVGDDPAEHQRLLAYASDLHILHTGLLPLAIGWAEPRLQDASLDHSIWFHDRFRVDEWLLYALDSPRAAGARALGRGTVFTRDGRLVASLAQEGLIRLPPVADR